ncbi:hypothetical protein [Thalassococcus sp. S3]|uniref:hypothetical protein n=1 Tax=Thalassococcus sp. S3 TaxID=2017482 RepID=UPI0013EE8015|nr:hypothetical protein [Thalassococcus sp. S3]
MSYYDNAVLMQLRLGLWRDPHRTPKAYEQEAEFLAELNGTRRRSMKVPLSGLLFWAG